MCGSAPHPCANGPSFKARYYSGDKRCVLLYAIPWGLRLNGGRVTLLFSLSGLRLASRFRVERKRSREKRKRKEVDFRQAGEGERSRRGHWGILELLLRLGRCFPWPPSLPLRGHATSQERCPRVEGRGGKLPSFKASLPGAPAQACQTPGSLRHSGVPRHRLYGGGTQCRGHQVRTHQNRR